MIRILRITIVVGLLLCIFMGNRINADELTSFQEDMNKIFEQVKAKHPNVNYASLSMSIMDIHTNNYWGIYDQLSTNTEGVGQYGGFLAASVIKFPTSYSVIKLAEKGELNLYEPYTDPVSGKKFRPIDKIVSAVTRSINADINTLLRTFTPAAINNELTELGYPNIKMFSEIGGGDPYQSPSNNMKRYGNSLGGRINSYEMALLFKNFYLDYLNEVTGTKELYTALRDTIYRDRIPKGIDYRYPVVHKTGTIGAPDGTYNDCGIILVDEKPFIICFVDQGQKGVYILPFIRDMAQAVTSYMEQAELKDVVTESTVEIILNDAPIRFDQPVKMIDGKINVPFRVLAELMNMEVLWNGESNEVTAYYEALEIAFTINNNTVMVNGNAFEMDEKPYIDNSTTMISLNFIADIFGLEIQFEENEGETLVYLVTKP